MPNKPSSIYDRGTITLTRGKNVELSFKTWVEAGTELRPYPLSAG